MAASFQPYRSLIENSPDAISLLDPQGKILYASAPIAKVLGYQPEEFVGRNCVDLVHLEDRSHMSRVLKEVAIEPSSSRRWDARYCRKDGSWSWLECTVSNMLEEPGVNAFAINFRDTNARRASELAQHRHAEELACSNLRLEEFAYTAAHDLVEPLRAISVYTTKLVDNPNDSNTKAYGRFIVDGARRMSNLIDDLLSFASIGNHERRQSVDLRDVLTQALQNLAPAIQSSGARVLMDELPIVRSNEIHLMRLFQNLIGNAIKYRSKEAVEIHVTAERRGQYWVMKIRDNGVGIAPEDHARVFLPFTRLVDRDIPGSGLGLAVCKKIVQDLGGTIWIESGPGAGSTFCFTIASAAEDIPVQGISASAGGGNKQSVAATANHILR